MVDRLSIYYSPQHIYWLSFAFLVLVTSRALFPAESWCLKCTWMGRDMDKARRQIWINRSCSNVLPVQTATLTKFSLFGLQGERRCAIHLEISEFLSIHFAALLQPIAKKKGNVFGSN